MSELKVAIVQADLYWENKSANFAHLEELITSNREAVDVTVLPEMFATGFSMKADQLAEPMNLGTTKWMKLMATKSQSVVVGSFIVKEAGKFFNRLLAVNPSGEIVCQYDKQYLFPLSFEHETFVAGDKTVFFEVNDFKIKPQICYDLRFPESSRYSKEMPQDVLLYIANWPAKRTEHWNVLLQARAIENQSYVIACNRIGDDGNGLAYKGESQVITPDGKIMCESTKEEVLVVSLQKESLSAYREKFPVLRSIKD